MRTWVRRMKSIRVYRVEVDRRWVWADWGGWGPGSARTKLGAYLLAARA